MQQSVNFDPAKNVSASILKPLWRRGLDSSKAGLLLTVFGIGLALVAWIFKPDSNVKLWVVIVLVAALFALIFQLIEICRSVYRDLEAFHNNLDDLTKCRIVKASRELSFSAKDCIIATRHPLFSQDGYVGFYFLRSDEFEVKIGSGKILIIQSNGLMQIKVESFEPGTDETWKKIWENNEDSLNRMHIRALTNILVQIPSGYTTSFSSRPPLEQ